MADDTTFSISAEVEGDIFEGLVSIESCVAIVNKVLSELHHDDRKKKLSPKQEVGLGALLKSKQPKDIEALKAVLKQFMYGKGATTGTVAPGGAKDGVDLKIEIAIQQEKLKVAQKIRSKYTSEIDEPEAEIEVPSSLGSSALESEDDSDASDKEEVGEKNLLEDLGLEDLGVQDGDEERLKTAKKEADDKLGDIESDKMLAALRIQAGFRGYKVRKEIKEMKKNLTPQQKETKKSSEAAINKWILSKDFPNNDVNNEAAITIQAAFRGYRTRKATDEMLRIRKLEHEAATKIQALWRGYRQRRGELTPEMIDKIRADAEAAKRAREDAAEEARRAEEEAKKAREAAAEEARRAEEERRKKEAEIQKVLDDAFKNRDDKYPKKLDRRQAEREILAFERKNGKSPFIKGIYGHHDKLVENEPDIEQFHLGIKRHHKRDLIELHSSGFLVAEYQNPIQLQAHIEAVRRAHEASKLQGGTPLLEKGEVRMMFAKYPSHKYNARGERLATDDQYILLVQTADGITQSFVDAEVVTQKQKQANDSKDNEAYYKNHLQEYLEQEGYFAEVAAGVDPVAYKEAAMERAQHKMRHVIREGVVVAKTTEEIREGQKRAKRVSRLNGADIDHIVKAREFSLTDKSDRQILNTDKKFRKKIALFERISNHAISSSDHGGFSINENRHGAYITFNNPASTIDICYKAIPGTSYVIRVCVATKDGPHFTFKDGQRITKYCQKGDVLIDENTVHFFDGRDYKPLCVHTNYLEKNSKPDTLKNHKLSQYQGGAKGFKGVQAMYDAFAIVATSDFDGVRKCATKVGKEINNQVSLGTTISLDHEGNDLALRRKIAPVADIATVSLEDQTKKKSAIDEIMVECPNFGGKKRPKKLEDSADFQDNLDRIKSFGDDGKIYVKLTRAYSAPGQNSTAYYSNIVPRREFYVLKGGKYIALTKEIVARPDEVPATTPVNEGHGENVRIRPPVNPKKNSEFLETFTKEFFDEVVVDYKIEDEVCQKEQDLRKAVARGDVEAVKELLKEYTDRKKLIEDRIANGEMTSAEAETFRRDLNFDINAKNSNAGENALHIAAKSGNKELVKMLLDAGADARISTAPNVAQEGTKKGTGQKALQTAAEYATAYVLNPFFWTDLLIYGDPWGRPNHGKSDKAPKKDAAQIAVESGNNNKAEKDSMAAILQKSAQERQHEEYAKYRATLEKDVEIYGKRADKLAKAILYKDADGKLTGLVPELRLVSHQAIAAARAHADELKNNPSDTAKIKFLFEQKTALEEKSKALTKELREAREKLRQADFSLGVAKEALGKPKPLPPIAKEGLVPTPEKYEIVPYRIAYGPDDNKKYFDVNLYLIKEDNAVVERYNNGKVERVEFARKGAIGFDLDTVHYFGNKDEGGLRHVAMESRKVFVKPKSILDKVEFEDKFEVPKEFEGDKQLWEQARQAFKDFEENLYKDDFALVKDVLPDDFKDARANMLKAQEEARAALRASKEVDLRSEIDLAIKEFSAGKGYIPGLSVAAGGAGPDSGHAGDHNPLSNDLLSEPPSVAPGPVLTAEPLPEVVERQAEAEAEAKGMKFFGPKVRTVTSGGRGGGTTAPAA